jgi:hypothetical protein
MANPLEDTVQLFAPVEEYFNNRRHEKHCLLECDVL